MMLRARASTSGSSAIIELANLRGIRGARRTHQAQRRLGIQMGDGRLRGRRGPTKSRCSRIEPFTRGGETPHASFPRPPEPNHIALGTLRRKAPTAAPWREHRRAAHTIVKLLWVRARPVERVANCVAPNDALPLAS